MESGSGGWWVVGVVFLGKTYGKGEGGGEGGGSKSGEMKSLQDLHEDKTLIMFLRLQLGDAFAPRDSEMV